MLLEDGLLDVFADSLTDVGRVPSGIVLPKAVAVA